MIEQTFEATPVFLFAPKLVSVSAWRMIMIILKRFTIVAALLAGGTSLGGKTVSLGAANRR